EYSMYPSEFGVLLSAAATPSEPFAPCPPGAFHTLSWSYVQELPAAAVRYLVKLSVVPDESDRWKVTIVALGRLTPEFSAVIAGSFHFVTVPAKIFASTSGVTVRLLTPGTLYATAIGPITIGMSIALLPAPQRASALGCSSDFSAESEPANEVWSLMKSCTPAPEPDGE